ncbi:MAG: hypothetical protein E7596_06825 [Ruminococcaceae bacterium]|nr:hypothetical protein [Oscillospiraceae bacterium]
MKKIITLLIALALFSLLLISCADTEIPSGNLPSSTKDSQGESSPPSGETALSQPTTSQPNDQPPTDEEQNTPKDPVPVVISQFLNNQDYYPELKCGEYYGKDFMGTGENQYRIIDTYEELCTRTAKGANFPESIFDDSIVLVIYRFEGTEDVGRIGYKDFKVTDGKASITMHSCRADYIDEIPAEWQEIVYLQLPKIDISENGNTIGGKLTVNRDKTKLYDMAQAEVYNTSLKLGTAYLLEPNELQGFLEKNSIASLNWKGYSSCENRDYKILVLYMETAYPSPIGYGKVLMGENSLTITREYNKSTAKQKKAVFEFVAIPSEEINISFNEETQLTIEHFGNFKEIKVDETRVYQTIKAYEPSHQYYEMLDLGVYYYFDMLPSTNAYHVIKSYEELEKYVEKPWSLSEADFKENAVLVLKIDKYDPEKAFGIRNISYSDRSLLRATLDYGRYYVEKEDVQEELSKEYQNGSYYYYLLVPRVEHDSKYREEKGSLNLTVNKLENRKDYYVYDYKPDASYQLKPNTSWILTNNADFGNFLRETGVNLLHHFSYEVDYQNKFVFAYYGALPWHTGFGGFLSNGENAYIDVSYYDNKNTYEPRIFAMAISKDLLHCTGEEITVHMAEYKQKEAVRRDGVDTICIPNNSFYVGGYRFEENGIIKEPDFEWKLIGNSSELLLALAKYTNLPKPPIDMDFKTQCVLAYYVEHGCTGCPDANSFGNVRVANNIMFIDNYVKNHSGGEAITPALHFIVIDNSDITAAFDRVVFLQKRAYVYEEGVSTKIESQYTTQIISDLGIGSASFLKKKPEFGFKFVESLEELRDLYGEYTNIEILEEFESLDFEAMCILAVYYEAGSSATVYGGFKDMRVENNRLYIKKYFPQYKGQDYVIGDCAEHPTLHLIAVEKSFTPHSIVDVIVTIEPWSSNMDILHPEIPDLME